MTPLGKERMLFLVLIGVTGLTSIEAVQLDTPHQTRTAYVNLNKLQCFTCHSMEDSRCINVNSTTSATNATNVANVTNATRDLFVTDCQDELRKTCMIKRYLYTTSTENTTSTPQLWALERNCTNKCEAGCIIIGERTKLYSCTECCNSSLCNFGKGTASTMALARDLALAYAIALLLAAS